ncbi:MAG: alpha/beta hydrolase-fold protein [Planctomycetota bacterium]|nr:alpha/beta hydrolase-fold protein [Planctomycetota bacterium]
MTTFARRLLTLSLCLGFTVALVGAWFGDALVRADDVPAKPAAVPQGTLTPYTFDQSRIFPGTKRGYAVYVPQQYDPAKPACVYISQDGINPRFTEALDQLIAKKEIPVMVAIGISPGHVPAPTPAAAGRGNRCFEYDGLGDAYARFLLEELLPYVAKEQQLNLSSDANDRCIGGCSSGGICAFNVAWERPDAFRRVYSNSGSFVAFRGGYIYPVLIRKYEAKPLRIFLHVGNDDMRNTGGEWWLLNQEMDRSLAFAGYDYNYSWSAGGHGHLYVDQFPEAMRWLWKDWPSPVKAGNGPPRLQDILIPGEAWQLVGDGYKEARSPAANPQGEVLFTDVPNGKTFKIGLDGKVTSTLAEAGPLKSLTFGAAGQLYAIAANAEKIITAESAGQVKTVAEGIRAHALTARHEGGLYVTSPGPRGTQESQIWFVDAQGEKKVVDTGLARATGVAISPDHWQLHVADGDSHWVYIYQIKPDGSLTNKQRFDWLHVPDGRAQGIIPTPNGNISGLCFGGQAFDTLFATCGDRVFMRKVKSTGAGAFHSPAKPAGAKL